MSLWITRWAISLALLAVGLATPNIATATSNAVPFLNPLVPDATPPGGPAFTLTVSGTGFVSASTVLWNGSPRATKFVSSSKLTAAIQASDIATAGTATVTVASPGPGGGISNSQFFQVVNAASQLYWTSLDVTNKVPITSPLLAGDFNNDGKLDIVGAIGEVVYVALGNGDGSFQKSHGTLGVIGSTITGINVADVNGDGKLDVVLTGSESSTTSFVAVMLGNGDGSFQAPVESDFPILEDSNGDESDFEGEHFRSRRNLEHSNEDESDFTGARFPSRPILADFKRDGVLDLVYATATGIQTLVGHKDGRFHKGPRSPLRQIGLNVLAVGDFNNDGKLDLVVSVYDPLTKREFVGVMLGEGDGSFGKLSRVPGTETSFPSEITAVAADFNKDGNLDIATGIQTAGATIHGSIRVSLGKGDGTFQEGLPVPNVNSVTTPMLLGDFDGDGNLDLATGGFIYTGQGDGTFPNSQGSTTALPYALAGDFNGDGKLDILNEEVFTSGSTVLSRLGLYLQTPPQPDFKGIVPPSFPTLVPGSSVSIVVTVEPLNGFTGDVMISVSGLPNGISASFNPNPVVVQGGSGTSAITLTAASTVPLGNYSVMLTGSSGALTHWTTIPLVVNSSVGDWTGYVVQQDQNVSPGASATYTIVAQPLNGFNGNISLTFSGLPPGGTASFSPAIIAGGSGSSVLTVQTASTTPQPAIYPITVTGRNGILVHSTTVYVGVRSSTGDFGGTVSPLQATVSSSGGSVSFGLTISPVNGGAGDIKLTASGMPAGATANFNPPTIAGSSGNSTLTVTVGSGTPPGSYQIVITATGIGVIHQSSVTLTVTP